MNVAYSIRRIVRKNGNSRMKGIDRTKEQSVEEISNRPKTDEGCAAKLGAPLLLYAFR